MRILLAISQPNVLFALRVVLQQQPDLQVVGEALTGEDAIRLAGQLDPDLVLVDLSLSGLDGLEAARQIQDQWPAVRVIGLTTLIDKELRDRTIGMGVDALIEKGSGSEPMLAKIRQFHRPKHSNDSSPDSAIV
ncbi:MAG: response regulator transcription factor [Anaerolineales bacterium]|nr:response regulator transcription factor [Anaerolineales bacterium]